MKMEDLDFNGKLLAQNEKRRIAWILSLVCPLILVGTFILFHWDLADYRLTAISIITVHLIVVAAVCDIYWLKIPNWLTYPGVLWGIAINLLGLFVTEETRRSLGAVGLLESVIGLVVPFVFMLILFSATGGGAGDVKLTAALGALLGLNVVIDAILISFAMAGAIAVVKAIWVMGVWGFFEYVFRILGSYVLPLWISRPSKESSDMLRKPMPLAPSFAVGTIIAMLDSGALSSVAG